MLKRFEFADKKYVVSTIDTEALVEVVKVEKPDGIVTAATDMPMRAISNIGEKFNLNTISYDTALKATDKFKMREALSKNGVPIPKYYLVNNKNDYETALDSIKGKKIVKPVDSSGSRGIFLLENNSDIASAYEHAMENSRTNTILVEEYMEA
nr:ATP-grasp domain-containing protein [Staphylococcus sp. NRL 22/194]